MLKLKEEKNNSTMLQVNLEIGLSTIYYGFKSKKMSFTQK